MMTVDESRHRKAIQDKKRRFRVERRERAKAEAEREIRPELRECTVCAEDFPTMEFPQLAGCTHVADICRGCFNTWVDDQIKSGTLIADIQCPESDCVTAVSEPDVQQHAYPQFCDRYNRLSNITRYSEIPGFRLCNGPSCSSGQIRDRGNTGNDIFRCTECSFRMCVNHGNSITDGVPMHDGESCNAYDERIAWQKLPTAAQEAASRAVIDQDTVRCPGEGCRYSIQKNHGCDHMTCSRCRFQFCYICSAAYGGRNGIHTQGNAAHEPSCRHYRPPPPPRQQLQPQQLLTPTNIPIPLPRRRSNHSPNSRRRLTWSWPTQFASPRSRTFAPRQNPDLPNLPQDRRTKRPRGDNGDIALPEPENDGGE
ncbi:hypothetical protein T440DRAFT_472529 [Plenodomus tracheiphilus IPT5]|uniref:RBR-type E3 ubiquitin transferase n=1 Tax=Plenodomus tracheiphilus IPT5 TaxID=1408161 RepID=A0A6A7AU25_9PLEO|nr:hypothetical protein T440DRAFT_472529 [Plenodomus tracheiphilus IPT5]